MAVIFHTSVHFLLRGCRYLTERSSVCDFDETFNFLSNNSHIIATYAEVLKYSVKSVEFNMLERIIQKVIIPNLFDQCIYPTVLFQFVIHNSFVDK